MHGFLPSKEDRILRKQRTTMAGEGKIKTVMGIQKAMIN
jgi:hypothetical protein